MSDRHPNLNTPAQSKMDNSGTAAHHGAPTGADAQHAQAIEAARTVNGQLFETH